MSDRSPDGTTTRILTVPNLLSFARILLIPVFVFLIVHEGTELAGVLVFAGVAATDWVDGYIARRTGQVSELGKILDPTADRLVIVAGLVAMVLRDVFPLWAALLIVVRDALVLAGGVVLLAAHRGRIEVRVIGKVATFSLMTAVTWVAWGGFELPLATVATVAGWAFFGIGLVEYYLAAALYVGDLRRALAG